MKKTLFFLALLIGLTTNLLAQITFNLTTPPCNNDGVLNVTIDPSANLIAPYTIVYYIGGQQSIIRTITSGYTDVLNGYSGSNCYVLAYDSHNHSTNGYYAGSPAFTFDVIRTPAICPALGTINITNLTGTAPYSFSWENVITNQIVGQTNPISVASGAYHATVTDGRGCTVSMNDSIYIQNRSPISGTLNTVQANCPALGTAAITNLTGGIAPYTYTWSTGAATSAINNLHEGSYYATVTDAQGCSNNFYTYIQDAFTISATVLTTPASCTNGSASLTNIVGGIAPYTYLWSNGATSASINNLTSGIYYVTITDGNGCFGYSIYAGITQNPVITAHTTATPATCLNSNGGITAFGSGGVSPYTYLWDNGATTASINNVPKGYYSVTATDANGCTGMAGSYVTATTPIQVTYNSTPSSCTAPTGSASITIAGGTTPYTTTWGTVPATHATTISNKAAGNYFFSITDAVGCEQSGAVNIPPIHTITALLLSSSATCLASNGSLNAIASGGTTPYTYHWSNNATTAAIANLPANNYMVTITDNVGCSTIKGQTVFASSPIHLGIATVPVTCEYSMNGSATAQAIGGTAPYTYSWSNGATTPIINNLGQGGYVINVRDAVGCTASNYTYINNSATSTACYCTIKGTVFTDTNSDCVQNTGENGLQNILIHCSGFGYTYTDINGNYAFKVPTGTYTISEVVQTFYPLSSCQNNSNAVSVVANTGCTHTINFSNTILPVHDVKINTWSITPPRPGFTYNQQVIVSNQGTLPEPNNYIGYRQDAQIPAANIGFPQYLNMQQTNFYNTDGTTTPAVSLLPGTSENLDINYQIPSNIPLGTNLFFRDTIAHVAPVTTWLNDYTPWDNVNYYSTTTVGSYDPNFKEVYPKGTGVTGIIEKADTVLNYAIHFQNIGTYEAQNVVIIDTLNSNLDFKTLKPLYKSHNCAITINEQGVMKFNFKNIHLPAQSQNENASKGMVTYSVHLKRNLPQGTKITNSAAIYFDFNAPIITNKTTNTTKVITDTDPSAPAFTSSFTLYPNPTSGNINVIIETDRDETQTAELAVMNILGQKLTTQPITLQRGSQTVSINTDNLAAGVYFATITTSTGNTPIHTQKFIKTK